MQMTQSSLRVSVRLGGAAQIIWASAIGEPREWPGEMLPYSVFSYCILYYMRRAAEW